ncbi:MAG: alpha/beta fold hydrolase [Candidatus Poribacteria bacterium]|nr:alpha/beta fold hydrolase [Candidatus Poribacteria bacterium]MDE0503358.1 alpha/beta fold hydrolase [Candidatus Poribacteria bacterium]
MFGDIRNSHGERLDYSFHQGEGDSKHIVVLGHGVTGNKDRPFVVALANGLAASGIPVLRFSFSGNGDSEGRFVDSTISKEVEDLGSVLDALSGYSVCYAGHSMGGAVGVLRASRDSRIKLLVSLAGMVHTKTFAQTEFGGETPDEGLMWDKPECPLSSAYMDDMAQIDSVVNRASRITVPWLLVHGTEDDVVPIAESREILEIANQPKELIELAGADHVFSDEATSVMVTKVALWVQTQIGNLG